MNAVEAEAKAKRAERCGHLCALVAAAFGVGGLYGLLTDQPVLSTVQGTIGAGSGILTCMAYRAADHWHVLAAQMTRKRWLRESVDGSTVEC